MGVPEQMLSRVEGPDYFGSFGLVPAGMVAGPAAAGAIIARPWLREVQ